MNSEISTLIMTICEGNSVGKLIFFHNKVKKKEN